MLALEANENLTAAPGFFCNDPLTPRKSCTLGFTGSATLGEGLQRAEGGSGGGGSGGRGGKWSREVFESSSE